MPANHTRSKTASSALTDSPKVITTESDRLSPAIADLVPRQFVGSERYLDVVQWNLQYFKDSDAARVQRVVEILDILNGDLFVFQEIEGPADGRRGALDVVANQLRERGAGDYRVAYGALGGQQRLAFMWDIDWLRTKADIHELYEKGQHVTATGKDAFAGRSPLYGYFDARPATPALDTAHFDFQMLGLHLKSQVGGGGEQRLKSAQVLVDWLTSTAPRTDADVLLLGDWNKEPGDACWAPFHMLEREGKAEFTKINDPTQFSHLYFRNKQQWGSRLDLAAMSLSSAARWKSTEIVLWKPIKDVIAMAGGYSAGELNDVVTEIRQTLSDHLPVVSRFFFTTPGTL